MPQLCDSYQYQGVAPKSYSIFNNSGMISFLFLLFLCIAVVANLLSFNLQEGVNQLAIYFQEAIVPPAILESAMPILAWADTQDSVLKKANDYPMLVPLQKQLFIWESPLLIIQSQIPMSYFSDAIFQAGEKREVIPASEPTAQNNQEFTMPLIKTVNGVKVVFVGKNEYYPLQNGYTGDSALSNVKEYIPMVKKYSSQYNLDPAVPLAIMSIESGGNPNAVSDKGALGLMQITQDTAKEWGLWDPLNAEDNITTGIKILHYYYQVYKGNMALMAAAYNAGSGAVLKYKGVPDYAETQNYVKAFNYWYTYYRGIVK